MLLFIAVFAVLSLFWSLFYFLIGAADRYFGTSLNPLLQHIVSSVLGILLFGMIMNLIGRFYQPKRITYFQAVIQAMRQMAKGNFKIDLNVPLPAPGPHMKNNLFVQLVDSVHYMARELGQLEHVRQEFISNVSHEIQSPLTSIKGFATALENENLPKDKRRHYLQIIRTESDRLSKLSDNLLKLTSLENGRHPVTMVTYRLDRQIRQGLLRLEPQWRGKNLRMVIDLDPVDITADSDLIDQVWMNLLQNSIKFTPEGGTITVRLNLKKDEAIFSVSDTGIGIRKEDRIHLFERFYKADRSRTRNTGGSGLGLSIVKKIIDVHHGTIQIESEYKKGTMVTVGLKTRSV